MSKSWMTRAMITGILFQAHLRSDDECVGVSRLFASPDDAVPFPPQLDDIGRVRRCREPQIAPAGRRPSR
jgi:hypothetical protein